MANQSTFQHAAFLFWIRHKIKLIGFVAYISLSCAIVASLNKTPILGSHQDEWISNDNYENKIKNLEQQIVLFRKEISEIRNELKEERQKSAELKRQLQKKTSQLKRSSRRTNKKVAKRKFRKKQKVISINFDEENPWN